MAGRQAGRGSQGAHQEEAAPPYWGFIGLYALIEARENDLRGRLLLGGTRPESLTLKDWLDAGERMIFEGAAEDTMLFDILSRLVKCESEDAMKLCFDELTELNNVRQIDYDKVLRKERAEKGLAGRGVSDRELQEAADEWASIGQPAEGDE